MARTASISINVNAFGCRTLTAEKRVQGRPFAKENILTRRIFVESEKPRPANGFFQHGHWPMASSERLSEKQKLTIMRSIFRTLQSSPVGASQIEAILQDFTLPEDDLEARIFILTRLAEIFRELSLKTFRSVDQRIEILDAVQEVLDKYIEMEDVICEEVR
jgi:type III secretion system TyeA family effector delivery regulator